MVTASNKGGNGALKVLGIETSSRMGSLALMEGTTLLAEYSLLLPFKHAEKLVPLLDTLLKETQTALSDLHGIAVSLGPGSFTGLRVGLATAKGLALAMGIPLLPVSTLEAMAFPFCHAEAVIAPIMAARKEAVYWSLFADEKGAFVRLYPDSVTSLEEGATLLGNHVPKRKQLVIVAPEDTALKDRIVQAFGNEGIVHIVPFPRASSVAELGMRQLARGEGKSQEEVVPLYLSPFQPSVFPS